MGVQDSSLLTRPRGRGGRYRWGRVSDSDAGRFDKEAPRLRCKDMGTVKGALQTQVQVTAFPSCLWGLFPAH